MLRSLVTAAVLLASCASAQAYEPSINYMLQCMGCHTPDGSGEPGRVPSVRMTLIPFARIPAGRRFLVQVPGSAQSTLSDGELAELLNWMIGNLSDPEARQTFTRYTGEEVAQYRSSKLTDVRGTRERLLHMTR